MPLVSPINLVARSKYYNLIEKKKKKKKNCRNKGNDFERKITKNK